MKFDYREDKQHFEEIFFEIGGLIKHSHLFDFRPPFEKRKEFGPQRDRIYNEFVKIYGDSCQLKYHESCTGVADVVDHLVPLSSNKLNKELRRMVGQNGKKVPTQSFGSNHRDNLVLSCTNCNGKKMNHIPTTEIIKRIFEERALVNK